MKNKNKKEITINLNLNLFIKRPTKKGERNPEKVRTHVLKTDV